MVQSNPVLDLSRIDVAADLDCEFNGAKIRVHSEPDRLIVCDLPNAKTLFDLRRAYGRPQLMKQAADWLQSADQTVEIRVGGKAIARLGSQADGRLMKAVGLPATEWRLWETVKLLFQR